MGSVPIPEKIRQELKRNNTGRAKDFNRFLKTNPTHADMKAMLQAGWPEHPWERPEAGQAPGVALLGPKLDHLVGDVIDVHLPQELLTPEERKRGTWVKDPTLNGAAPEVVLTDEEERLLAAQAPAKLRENGAVRGARLPQRRVLPEKLRALEPFLGKDAAGPYLLPERTEAAVDAVWCSSIGEQRDTRGAWTAAQTLQVLERQGMLRESVADALARVRLLSGARLRQIRTARGLKPTALQKLLFELDPQLAPTSPTAIPKWESDTFRPFGTRIHMLAVVLEAAETWFYADGPPIPPLAPFAPAPPRSAAPAAPEPASPSPPERLPTTGNDSFTLPIPEQLLAPVGEAEPRPGTLAEVATQLRRAAAVLDQEVQERQEDHKRDAELAELRQQVVNLKGIVHTQRASIAALERQLMGDG